MSKRVEDNYPGTHPGGSMDRQRFEDDSSAVLGLGHGYRGRQDAENETYRKSILDAGLVDWLITYFKADPETRELQPRDMENLAIDRYLSIRGGAHERVKTYVDRGMELRAAIMKAEGDVTLADEAEAEPGEPKAKDEYLGASLDELMDVHKKTTGGGSKSKSYKTVKRADAPTVEQALRKQMAA